MESEWFRYIGLNSSFEGTRKKFEKDCEQLIRLVYKPQNTYSVKVNRGDDGIDIFVGEFIAPIKVFQCKAFFDKLNESRKAQIRKSFNRSILSENYKMIEWNLCIPKDLTMEEHEWWSNWKSKMEIKHALPSDFIKLISGGELIGLFKKHNIYDRVFEIEELQLVKDTNRTLKRVNKKVDSLF